MAHDDLEVMTDLDFSTNRTEEHRLPGYYRSILVFDDLDIARAALQRARVANSAECIATAEAEVKTATDWLASTVLDPGLVHGDVNGTIADRVRLWLGGLHRTKDQGGVLSDQELAVLEAAEVPDRYNYRKFGVDEVKKAVEKQRAWLATKQQAEANAQA